MSKISTKIAVFLTFVAGIAGIAALLNFQTNISSWLAAVFVFLSVIFQVIVIFFDRHKDYLEKKFKNTRPDLNVSIKTDEKTKKFCVAIESNNNIPFEFDFRVVTLDNIIVSGIFLEWGKYYPTNTNPICFESIEINTEKVIDSYVELRFKFRSIFAAEMHDLSNSGEITKSYLLSPDKLYCIPFTQNDIPK